MEMKPPPVRIRICEICKGDHAKYTKCQLQQNLNLALAVIDFKNFEIKSLQKELRFFRFMAAIMTSVTIFSVLISTFFILK